MHNKIAFIAGSILDNQSTIKAIDVKIGALLVALFTPFSQIDKIYNKIQNIFQYKTYFSYFLFITFFIFWLLSILILIKALLAIDNPKIHIINSEQRKGIFYSPGLYNFYFLDSFLNRKIIKSNYTVSDFNNLFPKIEQEIEEELSFELMKLVYIRDIKIYRLKIGVIFGILWIVVSFICFIYLKMGK